MKQLLDRLRKAPWEHRDPARRAEAVADSDDAVLLARLPELARGDDAPAVRLAAVRRLRDLALLGDRMRNDTDAAVRAGARERYRNALVDPALASQAERERVLAVEDDAEVLAHVAASAPEAAVRKLAIERARKPALLIERCQRDPDPELRLWLLQRIETESVLERIADQARRNDKRLARAARERLLALRLAAGNPETLRLRALALCDELDALRRALPPDVDEQQQSLVREWEQLRARVAPELATRVDGFVHALAAARAPRAAPDQAVVPVEAHAVGDAPSAPSPESAPTEPTATRDPDPELAKLADELDSLPAEAQLRTLDGIRKRFERRWRAIAQPLVDELAAKQRFDDALRTRMQVAQERDRARELAFEQALVKLEQALARDELAASRTAQAELEAARAGAPLSGAHATRLAAADAKLGELTRWQHWSNNKVRARVCDELEQLAAAGLHPDAIATRVRDAQTEWARLAQSELVPGQAAPETGLDRRFRALCHRTLAPARGYFEKRSDLRAQRSEEAARFIAETGATLDAASDPRTLSPLRRRIGEWMRRLDEVDPRQRGELGRKLRALIARTSEAQSAHAADAEAAKRKLLANLRRALAQAGLEDAIARAQAAQAEWQRLPRASREAEAVLANELRELVDPWFAKQKAERDAQVHAREASVQAERDVLAELAALAEGDDDLLRQADTRIAALAARWRALHAPAVPGGDEQRRDRAQHGERRDARWRDGRNARDDRGAGPRPPRGGRDNEREFDRAVERVREAQARAAHARELRALERLRAAAAHCDALEQRVLRGEQDQDADALASAWAPFAAEAGDVLAERHARACEWLARPPSREELDALAAAATARGEELALFAELLAGVESPPESRAARRELQMQRLAARMRGEAAADPREEARAIREEWLALGPLDALQRERIGTRIASALSGSALS